MRLASFRHPDGDWEILNGSRMFGFGCFRCNGGRGFRGVRRCLYTCVNRDVLRSLDSKPHSITPDFENRNLDIVGDYNFLVLLSANNQHETVSFKPPDTCLSFLKEKRFGSKIQKSGAGNLTPSNFNSFLAKLSRFSYGDANLKLKQNVWSMAE